ncbi:MAG: histidine phosphatase family protein [Boseongicola sp.]|nr:histidine phosphatase family protein [Boseongicola sp.]NNL18484.1 histidine phosphatase family protein [Boseongicola sp.]
MTLTLILTRHAKSSWGDPTLDDFDRTLNDRGRRSADAIGAWLAREGHLPDEVLVSGARRTVETWSHMAPHLPKTAKMASNPALYLSSAQTILGVLRTQSVPTCMIICHNPGIADFAERITIEPHPHPRFNDYPTCATAIVRFDATNWSEIDWNTGTATDFIVPRDLVD